MQAVIEKSGSKRSATVLSGQGTSDVVKMEGVSSGVMVLPSALTSTTAKWSVSYDGVTFATLADGAGSDVSTTVAASKAVALPSGLAGCQSFKVVLGSNEVADRVLNFFLKA